MALEDGTPRDERELARFLDHGVFATGELDRAAERTFDRLARADLGIEETERNAP